MGSQSAGVLGLERAAARPWRDSMGAGRRWGLACGGPITGSLLFAFLAAAAVPNEWQTLSRADRASTSPRSAVPSNREPDVFVAEAQGDAEGTASGELALAHEEVSSPARSPSRSELPRKGAPALRRRLPSGAAPPEELPSQNAPPDDALAREELERQEELEHPSFIKKMIDKAAGYQGMDTTHLTVEDILGRPLRNRTPKPTQEEPEEGQDPIVEALRDAVDDAAQPPSGGEGSPPGSSAPQGAGEDRAPTVTPE